jgi:hypothetical protein
MHTVYEGSEGRMLVTDSCTYCDERVRTTDVIIAGSFAGEIAAAMALRRGARAFLGNAAGIGRGGTSTYEHGIISYCNAVAQARGVRQGQTAKTACLALLIAYQRERSQRKARLIEISGKAIQK